MASLLQGRGAAGFKLRRQRQRWLGFTASGLFMIGMMFFRSNSGPRGVHNSAGPGHGISSGRVLDLGIIIDARQVTRSSSVSASHLLLSNALCMPARLGVFAGADPQLPMTGSLATILVDDLESAARINRDWWFGNAARPGGAEDGRRAAVASMEAARGFVMAPASALWTQDLREALFTRTPVYATDRPGGHVDLTCDVAMASSTGEPSILGVRPTRGGRRFVEALIQCEAGAVALDGRRHGPTGRGGLTSQPDGRSALFFLLHACATRLPPSRPTCASVFQVGRARTCL